MPVHLFAPVCPPRNRHVCALCNRLQNEGHSRISSSENESRFLGWILLSCLVTEIRIQILLCFPHRQLTKATLFYGQDTFHDYWSTHHQGNVHCHQLLSVVQYWGTRLCNSIQTEEQGSAGLWCNFFPRSTCPLVELQKARCPEQSSPKPA